jgi:hypothetical protein
MAWMGFIYSALLFIVLAYNFAVMLKEDAVKRKKELEEQSKYDPDKVIWKSKQ